MIQERPDEARRNEENERTTEIPTSVKVDYTSPVRPDQKIVLTDPKSA